MPDIGFGEVLVIVVIALLVFGPDRLPKVAADTARTLRHVRQMAVNARQDLVDASGFDGEDDVSQAVNDLRDLDPRRAASDVMGERAGSGQTGARNGRIRPDSAAQGPAGGAAAGQASSGAAAAAAAGSGAEPDPAQPVAPPVIDAAPVDPDWT